VAGREGERGECQTGLGLVWRETGAIRNARASRGRAASTRKRTQWERCEAAQLTNALEGIDKSSLAKGLRLKSAQQIREE